MAAAVLAITACGHDAGSSDQPASSPRSTVDTNFDQIPGQYPLQAPGIPGAAIAPVGACVSFDGPSTNATLRIVDCGSPTNGYKVVQRVATPNECPSDVAQKFYMNPEEGQFTACLDYAWSSKDCLSIGKVTAVRAACDDANAPAKEKPLNVVLNSVTEKDCPTGGFAHPVRRFTVCTQTQRP